MKRILLVLVSCAAAGCTTTSTGPTDADLIVSSPAAVARNGSLYAVVAESGAVTNESELSSGPSSPELDDALKKMLSRLKKESGVERGRNSRWVEGVYTVKKGDTLSQIVSESMAGTNIKADFLLDTIVKLNPRAFVRGNPNWLLAGAKLRFPSSDDFQKIIFKNESFTSKTESPEPYNGWIKYP